MDNRLSWDGPSLHSSWNTSWSEDTDICVGCNFSFLEGQFSAAGTGGLAYRASSDTLWFVQNAQDPMLVREYSKTGTLLQTQSYNFGQPWNNWGAAFAAANAQTGSE